MLYTHTIVHFTSQKVHDFAPWHLLFLFYIRTVRKTLGNKNVRVLSNIGLRHVYDLHVEHEFYKNV